MKRLAVLCALLAAFAVLAAPAHAQRRWGLEIGHSYSSTQALHQPATFTMNVADSVTTQTKRVALGIGLNDEHGTSAASLVLAVPFRSIASVGARWGFGPILGFGSVANPGR